MPKLWAMILGSTLMYITYYILCCIVDKMDIEKQKKTVKLNKYTNILFFLWKRNEKLYWLVYIMIVIESIFFVLLWIFYILKNEYIFKIVINIYVCIYAYGITILGIKAFVKKVKDHISGKNI